MNIPASTPAFSENTLSQLSALHLLQKLGWTLLTPTEALKLRGGRKAEVILRPILEKQLTELNRFEYRGEVHQFDRTAIEEGIRALSDPGEDGLVRTNEKVWELLRFGKGIPQTVEGDTKSYQLRYVDWERPQRNQYSMSDEFVVEAFGAATSRRPDIVLFVNGIPFAVIECKRPGSNSDEDPVEQAISQQLRNQREGEIPKLFHYAQLLFALAVNEAKFGATGTSLPFWQGWRERGQEEVLAKLLATPLTPEESRRTFASDPHRFEGSTTKSMQTLWTQLIAEGRTPSVQDELLLATARPDRLLALASRYTVFEGGERKIARYQQYFAVEEILKRVTDINSEGRRRGGLIWHTQGSGKSLTMVMLAEALLTRFADRNPQVVLVTDRVDLDDQIYGTFIASGVETAQASTGKHLLELLERGRTQAITTLLQKFEAAVNVKDAKLNSPDIFVLVDEGHRSQTGQFHAAMRRVLPRACFIGFTGTPVFKSQLPTIEHFGGLIGSAYTIDQAVADKAVVPLLYEGRFVHQQVDQIPIDEWFKRYTVGLTEEQRKDLKSKYSSGDQLNRTEQKIRAISWDLSSHFQTNFKGAGFKGQLVAPSKATALQYKRFLDEFGMVSSEVLISPPDTREGNDDVDEGEGRGKRAVNEFWERMIKRFGNESRYQKDITTRFKSADDPEIVIVVDKLLTGFDAPRNAVLYLTRSLRDHKLLQAIARVNRVSEGKDVGLVVDYYGVLEHLSEALEQYTDAAKDFEAHLQDVLTPLDAAVAELPQRHSDVWDVFKTVSRKNDQEAMERYLKDEAERQRFYGYLTAFARALRLAFASVSFHEQTPPEQIERYRRDLKYFMHLRASVARRYAERVDFKQYQAAIQKLLDTYVGAGDVETLVDPVSILDKEVFAKDVEEAGDSEAKAEMIANRMKRSIHEHFDEDPVLYRKFSELIEKALLDARENRITQLDCLKQMEELCDRVRDRKGYEDVPEALKSRQEARSYYDVVRDQLTMAQISIPDSVAADLATSMDDIILAHRKVDWADDTDVQNRMKIDIEDRIFALKAQHHLTLSFETIDRILDRVIDIARRRVP